MTKTFFTVITKNSYVNLVNMSLLNEYLIGTTAKDELFSIRKTDITSITHCIIYNENRCITTNILLEEIDAPSITPQYNQNEYEEYLEWHQDIGR